MPQATYTLSRKADRAKLADRLCSQLATVPGVTVKREDEAPGYRPREIRITVSANGVRASFGLDGDSRWGVFASWNFDYETRANRLFASGFQALLDNQGGRPHHKATGPFMGCSDARLPFGEHQADIFAAIINRAMRRVLDGSAFVQDQRAPT